jgi:iron complex outermembrane receptor protein
VRLTVAAAISCILLSSLPAAEPAAAAINQSIDIPPEGLGSALETFARDRKLQLIYATDDVENRYTNGAVGNLSAGDALKRILKGTGLSYQFLDANTVTVQPAGGSYGKAESESGATSSEGSKSVVRIQDLRLAQVNPPLTGADSSAQNVSQTSSNSSRLTEILVTAQKKTERLQDVPESITVLDPQALAESGQNRLIDYFASVPGLNVAANSAGGGTNYVTIRGLSAGAYQNPIVSTVIDDVPATSSLQRAFGGDTSPDLDPSDLARIEVLKGPQGTLYGADSLGGLIKYVTADPSTEGVSGRVQLSGVDIPSGGFGYVVRGSVNIPVSDAFALRVSGFDRRDPGYIDDATTGRTNFNSADVYGGHVTALWRPVENFSVKLSGLIQQTQGDVSLFDSTEYGQSEFGRLTLHSLPGSTPYTTQDQLYSATLRWNVAGLEIVSVTGYVVNTLINWTDETTVFGTLAYACRLYPNPANPNYCNTNITGNISDGVLFYSHASTHKPSQELRIGSSIGHWLDWRVGGFYTHEEGDPWYGSYYGTNLATGAINSPFYTDKDTTETFQEYAAFGDVTAHIAERFDIDFGARESRNKQADQYVNVGTAVQFFNQAPAPDVGPLLQNTASAFTYQVAPRFRITPDLMAYARVATGYRVGGYNVTSTDPGAEGQVPAGYAPDKTTNYEVGIKGDLLDHRLNFDAAVYYIAWKSFQIDLTANEFFPYTANAGDAKSEGLEFSVKARPIEGLTITAEGSYDDAILTQSIPPSSSAYGEKGDRLPYSMRLSGGLTVNQDIHLSDEWIGSVGAAVNYVGSRPYEFVSTPSPGQEPAPRTIFPGYTMLNLFTGARYGTLRANFYVNNVTNARGILQITPASSLGNPGNPNGYVTTVTQPRTVGVMISKNF